VAAAAELDGLTEPALEASTGLLVTTADAVVYLLVAVYAGVVVVLKVEVQPYQPEVVV